MYFIKIFNVPSHKVQRLVIKLTRSVRDGKWNFERFSISQMKFSFFLFISASLVTWFRKFRRQPNIHSFPIIVAVARRNSWKLRGRWEKRTKSWPVTASRTATKSFRRAWLIPESRLNCFFVHICQPIWTNVHYSRPISLHRQRQSSP